MTASHTSQADFVELSGDYRALFLTGAEIARLDDDDVLDAGDVWGRSE